VKAKKKFKKNVVKYNNKKELNGERKITSKGILKFFLKATVGMFVVALAVGAVITLAGVKIYRSIDDIKHVKFDSILSENDEKYLIYLYEKDDDVCKYIEPTILEYFKKTTIPIYAVNMSDEENKESYDEMEIYIENKEKLTVNLSPAMILVEDGNIVDYGENVEDVMGLIGRFFIK